jgi:cation diffusion facilitator CzcD-associated flavoprotein CzcO
MTDHTHEAIIIGAGMSGLLAAIKLGEQDIRRWVIIDKATDIGGTWHENVYPGSGCDVPSHLYSYSFAPNPGWTRGYSLQAEIKQYFKDVAAKYGLMDRVRLNTEAKGAAWDDASATWTVTLKSGEMISAPILILGCGQLNKPAFAPIPGRDSFTGQQFHSAQWDHRVEMKGKRVGVIGSGASAIQFVPHLVRDAAHMTMFQRSANWILERKDKEIPVWLRKAFAVLPPLRLAQRGLIYALQDTFWPIFEKPGEKQAQKIKTMALDYMHSIIADPVLRAKMTPDYEIGCKRILVSDDFYPALAKPNAHVETQSIAAIEPKGVRLGDGSVHEFDVLVWGTGFDTHHFIAPLEVTGVGGRVLADDWREGAEAYRGVSVTGYPNMFILYGPNTNTGHISIIFMVEQQVNYVMQAIARIKGRKGAFVDVTAEAQAAYNADMQARLNASVWASGCNSWYRAASGKIPNNYVGRAGRFRKELKHFEATAYRVNTGP